MIRAVKCAMLSAMALVLVTTHAPNALGQEDETRTPAAAPPETPPPTPPVPPPQGEELQRPETASAPGTEAAPACNCGESEPGQFLGGHRFLPSFYLPDPFAITAVQLSAGMTEGDFTIPVGGAATGMKLGAITPRLDVKFPIAPRLAIFGGIRSTSIVALDGTAAADYGSSTVIAPNAGILWNFLRQEKLAVSFAFSWEKPKTLQSSPLEGSAIGVERFLGKGSQDVSGNSDVNRWRPDFRVAYAISKTIGVSGFAGADISATSFSNFSSSSTLAVLGASFEADLKPELKIPLALNATYRYTDLFNGDGDATHLYTAGAFETFSKHFAAGVEVGRVESGGLSATTGAVVVRNVY